MNTTNESEVLKHEWKRDFSNFARDLEIEGYTETNYGTILV